MKNRSGKIFRIRNSKGVALVMALIITLVIFLLVGSVMFFLNQSSTMSGVGKRYSTASEAADGAVNVVKDTINLVMWGDPVSSIFPGGGACSGQSYVLSEALLSENMPCTTSITLPAAMTGSYTATVTVVRLYSVTLPGGRLEFARTAGGVASTAVFYRITTMVRGTDNTSAENSALYRFTG